MSIWKVVLAYSIWPAMVPPGKSVNEMPAKSSVARCSVQLCSPPGSPMPSGFFTGTPMAASIAARSGMVAHRSSTTAAEAGAELSAAPSVSAGAAGSVAPSVSAGAAGSVAPGCAAGPAPLTVSAPLTGLSELHAPNNAAAIATAPRA